MWNPKLREGWKGCVAKIPWGTRQWVGRHLYKPHSYPYPHSSSLARSQEILTGSWIKQARWVTFLRATKPWWKLLHGGTLPNARKSSTISLLKGSTHTPVSLCICMLRLYLKWNYSYILFPPFTIIGSLYFAGFSFSIQNVIPFPFESQGPSNSFL